MLLNCVLEKILESLLTARRSNQSILKEISPEYSLKGLVLKLKDQNFGHLIKPEAGTDLSALQVPQTVSGGAGSPACLSCARSGLPTVPTHPPGHDMGRGQGTLSGGDPDLPGPNPSPAGYSQNILTWGRMLKLLSPCSLL